MKHLTSAFLVSVLAFATTSAGQERDPREGARPQAGQNANAIFVEFDRVYIPALALTNQGKPSAPKALQRLSQTWKSRFAKDFHQLFGQDPEWSNDISRMAQCIALAEVELDAEESLKAHEALEPIRDILMEARIRNEMDYPLDLLSRFHATMEAIVKPAMKMNAASLTRGQITEFARLGRQAEKEWRVVAKAEFDLAAFGKGKQEQRQFPTMLKAEQEAIQRLNVALVAENNKEIIEAARGLKPPFAKVYMYFGDFPKPR